MYHKTNKQRTRHDERGVAFLFVVFLLTVISVAIVTGFAEPNIRELQSANRDTTSNDAFLFSEAGSEDIFYRIVTGKPVPVEVVYTLGGRTSTTTVTSPTPNSRTIISQSAIGPHIRRSQMLLSNTVTEVELLYGAQLGSGGATLHQNAVVEGVSPAVGSIYSNGPISGANGSEVTGDVLVSTDVVQDFTASSTACVSDRHVGDFHPEEDFAQSFTSTSTDALKKVELFIKEDGNPSNIDVHIIADNGGKPGLTPLTTGTLDRNKGSSVYSWIDVEFSPTVTLVPDDTYWIVLDEEVNKNHYIWCEDTGNTYSEGSMSYSDEWDSLPWVNISGSDLAFKVYFGEGESTIDTVTIQGDAHANDILNSGITGDAYYQTITGGSVGGTSYPGSPTPLELPLPFTDTIVADWVADADAGGTISGNCPDILEPECTTAMGPKKIDGNLDIEGPTFTVTGTLHITGNLTNSNGTTLMCDAAYGADSCVVIVDGYIDVANNTTFDGSGSAGSFILLLSRKQDCRGGTQTASCALGNSAVYLKNNATGAIFSATDSVVHIENNVELTSVIAWGIVLTQGAHVIYDMEIEDITFSSGPGGGWIVNDWREVE